ncbi:hypothetical protein [Roseomonas marmotae]|uniref:DUF2786 domain-containing protein n=1 Tax=Roseomonas marmotae TaxID=2768161 RepID=A0ABS3KI82_9PROT|nr:hypothetical protein [Roseomonas marmotae]MBO1077167.1 hypothetical protein [Roseomonas marmotae]QTI81102.1 hypothetical protein IAI58_17180 [Roseomonas marmotae]
MAGEDDLRERLRKIEALIAGAGTAGEREAAGAALERVKARLAEQARCDPAVEQQFSMPDSWSRQLFVALCRRYGLRPCRYPRQKRTTVMLRAPKGFLDTVLWPEFLELELERALRAHLQGVAMRIIHDAVHADTSDAEEVNPALPGF